MTDTGSGYFKTLAPSAPPSLRSRLLSLPDETVQIVDTLLRLVLGAPCPSGIADDVRSTWDAAQKEAGSHIAQLKGVTSGADSRKREREGEASTSSSSGQSKRAKVSEEDTVPPVSDDSPDITIGIKTLRLTNPSTHALEHAPIPLKALHRAFLLPTRGKLKPHWTVILMPSDMPVTGGKAAKEKEEAPPVIFGLDATPRSLSTSSYLPDWSPQVTTYSKDTAALPLLRKFFSFLRVPVIEPSTDVFRSALPSGSSASPAEGIAGVEAYRAAKAGTLWFLSEGVLWDGRPAEFFALGDLAKTGKDGEVEGVRMISATGRTCSVILRRMEGEEMAEDSNEEERTVDVDFGMVDGKEQDGIARWIKKHSHLFGKRDQPAPPSTSTGQDVSGAKTNVNANRAAEVESDEDDSDFIGDSSSDGESTTSDLESESEGTGSDAEAEAIGSDEEADAEELDPEHHPLLRPGAMPRMSRSALDAVVGMMEADLAGDATGERMERAPHADDDNEEDELED